MIRVQVRPNETLEAALRRFKRQCNYAGIFRLAKKYSYHEKRSDKRRREDRERIRNIQRALRKAKKSRVRTTKRGRRKTAPQVENGEETAASEAVTTGGGKPETTAKVAAAPVAAKADAGQSAAEA